MNVYNSGKDLKLCLPVQHVSPRILSSMNRTYDVNNFKECLRVLTAAIPDLVISTHLMVGYPGETEEEFEELVEFVRWLVELNPKNDIKNALFCANPGTVASELDDQVPRKIGVKRKNRMWRVAIQHAHKVRQENKNKPEQAPTTGL
jgi:tRNA A37 methylthiotransferase MiaB